MGLYDEVGGVPSGYDSQFKCWHSDMNRFGLGEKVPDCLGTKEYSILLNSYEKTKPPMYLIVKEGRLSEFSSEPLEPVFSKWGVLLEKDEEPINPAEEAMKKVFKKMDMKFIDLRSFTRDSDKVKTTVSFRDHGTLQRWLVFGQCNLKPQNHGKALTLSGYLLDDVTDPEEDSAYALSLSLIGVQVSMVRYQNTILEAWISPDPDSFHVPRGGVDLLKDAETCTECEKEHLIVKNYKPPFDEELFRSVAGRQVEICIFSGVYDE